MGRVFKKLGNGLVFVLMAGVFVFSLYKILTITRVLERAVFGIQWLDPCAGGICDGEDNWCGCEWCGDGWCDWCWPCPSPTPTPGEPEPTLTPTPTDESGPTPTQESELPPLDGEAGPTDGGVGGPPDGEAGPPSNEAKEAPVCGVEKPGTPTLLSAEGRGETKLIWTEAERATHYSILYGEESGNYLYGVSNVGKVTSFTVGGLSPDRDYCFAVRAVNDCMPGDLSNEICTGEAVGGQVLGASTLADTGRFDLSKVALWGYTLGCVCLGIGIRVLRKASLVGGCCL